MSYGFYKLVHLIGLMMVFLSYGGLICRAILGSDERSIRVFNAAMSGVGLLFLFVSGFGMQAKLFPGFPTWVILKIVIWFVLGAMLVLINRKPSMGRVWWWSTLTLGVLAALLALQKPF